MDDDKIDFSNVRFRDEEVRHFSRREEAGTPFWRIVGAVLTALVLYGVLQSLVTVMLVRHAVGELEQKIVSLMAIPSIQANEPRPQQPRAGLPAPVRPHPAYLGPVEARKAGQGQACIGGYVSHRVEGGWSQSRQRCRPVSE